jgi:aspartyl-tRNA synthetase
LKRTHTCGELNAKNLEQAVVLCGWVHRRRDHGKVIFIDLRDRNGITQVVFWGKMLEVAKELKPEYVVAVEGKVHSRPKGTVNAKIPTGEIEIACEKMEIINPAKTPPFEIDDELDATEDLRLAYRYLDLRRPKVYQYFKKRHEILQRMRTFLDKRGFLEVETPILTKSTPEGARDYLVPARLVPGSFFALPQSPQLFKQILMVSGFERYFQIAKCLRDEDLRADRQPEFTQLDLEMSFVEEEEIYALIENLLQEIFQEILGKALKIPFPRITYAEAMAKYQSDKPNMQQKPGDFAFVWVTDFPLFKYNPEEKAWDSEHHPFTSPHPDDLELLKQRDLAKVRARSYDLVLNGVELGSGSIRIHRHDLQEQIFQILGLAEAEIESRFGFLIKAFDYGAPPHGGFAIGLDRLLSILLGTESIRDVIAFPKTQKGVCPLTNAPSPVSEKQLKELGISLRK